MFILKFLFGILNALDKCKSQVILPVHPRIKKLIEQYKFKPINNLKLIDPLGYLDFQKLLLGSMVRRLTLSQPSGLHDQS